MELELELTPFHGHLNVTKQGVRNVQSEESQAAASTRISPANGRTGKTGRRPGDLAKEIGCHETSIAGLVARASVAVPSLSTLPHTLHQSERAELLALRKANRQIKLERGILAMATAWFENKGDQMSMPSSR